MTQRVWTVLIFSSVLVSLVFGIVGFTPSSPGALRIIAFDVGQGDSLFVETPRHRQLLIDGGPDNAVLTKLGRAMPFGDRSLDAVILTHPDADHITGIVEVVRRYRIGTFIMTGAQKNTATHDALLEALRSRHVSVRYVQAGDRFWLDDDVALTVLSPVESWKDRESSAVNNTSVVTRLQFATFSALFTGDIEASVEHDMLRRHAVRPVSMLKAAHHGSRTSSSREFLDAARPKLAVISVGRDNSYGHPHKEVLARLHAKQIPT